MWSFCQISDRTAPKHNGEVHYIDQRTCVLPVKLERGKTYALWLNQGKFDSFRDGQNQPALPYFLVFETQK
jgi:RNA polymerase sigma-70 factor (ECF subfamily)